MRTLYRWGAEQAQSADLGAVIDKIRVLEAEIGARYKPDKLTILAKWVKLDKMASSLRKEQEYLRG
jgi:hypothetical protein